MACIAIQTILNRSFDFFRVSDLAQRNAISIADIQVTTHPVIIVICIIIVALAPHKYLKKHILCMTLDHTM